MQEISQPSILQRFHALKVWQRGDERAPHKPLLALADDRRVLVSEEAHGSRQFEQILFRHHGGQLNAPVQQEHHPSHSFVAWHRDQVFRGRPRPL
jgi:predicted restriction endonuclease